MLRIIICSNESGSKETVIFTEDFENKADYFCNPDLTVVIDEKRDIELPNGFPLEYTLRRD